MNIPNKISYILYSLICLGYFRKRRKLGTVKNYLVKVRKEKRLEKHIKGEKERKEREKGKGRLRSLD